MKTNLWPSIIKITHGNNPETPRELLAMSLSLNHLEKVADLKKYFSELPETNVISTKCLWFD